IDPMSQATMAQLPHAPIVGGGQPMGQPIVPPAGPQSSTQYAVRPSGLQQAQQMPNKALPTDYPVMAGGGRPMSSDLAPMSMPGGNSAQHAMHVMSPVGEQFPQTDWDAAAAQQAKALAPWQLAVL